MYICSAVYTAVVLFRTLVKVHGFVNQWKASQKWVAFFVYADVKFCFSILIAIYN